ncbi:alpha/beta fold hydrolase [Erythrobacter rubeus]|uniref:Alpha/beta hydrolase n=1 Tax=Erythrobacter rubeus TaxID=2760803 RepID=A0ABR8KTT1_9SPHN|nr:alpha/beta hydrolase [Erythrobacter rubeus]MBD2842623.1 alpha/beta hydrolase [Erythrobacter rubeus]
MEMRKGYADSSGGQIHFRHVAGEGMPVIFLHQTASSGKMWEKVMGHLAGKGPLYALDTPGFGGSFDPPHDDKPSMPDYARWLREAIEDLGISKCAMVGHHTGACIAIDMVDGDPDLVEKLALIGPVPLTAEERLEFSKHFGTPFTPTESGAYLMDNWDYLRNLGAHADPMLIHREMSDQLRAWWGRVQSYNAVWDQDFLGMYKRLTIPLLIGAAPDDVLFPFMERSKELQPDAKVVELTGANFEPDFDAETLARALADFIYS